MANEIQKDIEAAKISKNVNIEMLDGKIKANFSMNDNTENENGGFGKWTSYNKIFDNFSDFTDYTELFFKESI